MLQSTFSWVARELLSARTRTDLVVRYKWIEVKLSRRCSPYKSHRGIEFTSLEVTPTLHHACLTVVARDGILGIMEGELPLLTDLSSAELVLPFDLGEDWPHFDGEVVEIPSVLVRPLMDDLHEETGGLTPALSSYRDLGSLVRVIVIRRRVVGWHEDGHPIFSGREPDCAVATAQEVPA